MHTTHPTLSRRQLLHSATALACGLSLRAHSQNLKHHNGWILSGADSSQGEPHLLALERNGPRQYAWPLPGRAHDIALLPAAHNPGLGYCIARRPGTWLYYFNLNQGALLARIESPPDSHFYGHAASNSDGSLLYITENHYQTPSRPQPRGVIGIYQTRPPYKRLGEYNAQGLGPHQILFDATHQRLIIANGGNITHPSTEREVHNLNTMQPNISYLAAGSGKLLEQHTPPHHQLSLRHIALAANGLLAIGAQDQAPTRDPDEPAPLVFTHHTGQALTPLPASPQQWQNARQYIASMAISPNANAILASAPKANQLLHWQNTQAPQILTTPDTAGIAWNPSSNSFLASNSQGQLLNLTPNQLTPIPPKTQWRWDNHLFVG
ncbi:MAG: hypothetical protein RL497_1238 [Pseudomonadota bacterium]